MIKKLFGISVGAAMVLASVVPALAANQLGNQTTGPFSRNLAIRNYTKTAVVTIGNLGRLTQTSASTSVSGNNNADFNTQGGAATSGEALATNTKQASLNTGAYALSQDSAVADDMGVNDTTGPFSTNAIVFNSDKTAVVGVTNVGAITQTSSSTAVSGGNSSSFNKIGGTVNAGPATSDTTSTAILNDTVVSISQ